MGLRYIGSFAGLEYNMRKRTKVHQGIRDYGTTTYTVLRYIRKKQDLGTTINTGLWYNTENRIKVHQ